MNFKLKPYNRNIPDRELIADLRRVASKFKKKKLTRSQYRKHGKYSPKPFIRRFGGWLPALDKARLERTTNAHPEQYLKNLEKVWRKLRRQPTIREMSCPISEFSGRSYQRVFGSWQNALTAFIQYINNDRKISPQFQSKLAHRRRRLTKRTIGLQMRFLILKRDNFKCRLCGSSPSLDHAVKLHIDHIIPLDKGGKTSPENLQTLCSECNIGKGNTLLGLH